MATRAQIQANRSNARKSTGPKRTEMTRFNGLKHGLRAEEVIIPGESQADFDAERQGWLDDWRPRSHTAAAVCERAAITNWKLRRATRVEAARLYEVADAAAEEFDAFREGAIGRALRELHTDPGYALSWLTRGPIGLDALIGMWTALAEAASKPSGWTSRAEHHDRLLALLGHPAGSDPKALKVACASLALLASNQRGVEPEPSDAVAVRLACAEGLAEVRRQRSRYCDPPVYRQRAIDQASAPVTKEAQLLHRYEVAHENSLFRSIRTLFALSKADAEGDDALEAQPAVDGPAEQSPARGPDPAAPEKPTPNPNKEKTCVKLASFGAPAATPTPAPAAGPVSSPARVRPGVPEGRSGPSAAPARS